MRNVDLDRGRERTRRSDPEPAVDNAVGAVGADQLGPCHWSGIGPHDEAPVVLHGRHPSSFHEREVGPKQILLHEPVIERRAADGMKDRARMGEPVAAAVPQVELDRLERPAHGRIQRIPERRSRLHRHPPGARLHAWKAGGIDLRDAEARVQRHRGRVRAGRTGTHNDEVEVVHTWKIGNRRRDTTRRSRIRPDGRQQLPQRAVPGGPSRKACACAKFLAQVRDPSHG